MKTTKRIEHPFVWLFLILVGTGLSLAGVWFAISGEIRVGRTQLNQVQNITREAEPDAFWFAMSAWTLFCLAWWAGVWKLFQWVENAPPK